MKPWRTLEQYERRGECGDYHRACVIGRLGLGETGLGAIGMNQRMVRPRGIEPRSRAQKIQGISGIYDRRTEKCNRNYMLNHNEDGRWHRAQPTV